MRIFPTGGLGNKIRVLLSYYQLCCQNEAKLEVCWVPDQACPGKFLDWFKAIDNVSFHDSPTGIYHYKGCKRHEISKGALKMITCLRPRDIIVERLRKLVQKLGTYIAVHVRRTDHIELAKKNHKYTTDDQVENFITSHPDGNVYVATDNMKTYADLQEKFERRIILPYHHTIEGRLRHTTVVDAIVDLYMCSMATQFSGSGYSSFSGLIREIRKYNVQIVDTGMLLLEVDGTNSNM